LLGLKEIEVQIANASNPPYEGPEPARERPELPVGVDFHEQLLTNQLERLDVGRLDSHTVLETEEKLRSETGRARHLVKHQKRSWNWNWSAGPRCRHAA
jgi:hypothetical protein